MQSLLDVSLASFVDRKCDLMLRFKSPSHSCYSGGVSENVSGISGSLVKKFHSEEEALDAYEEALIHGQVIRVTLTITHETLHA
jgi:hypothetical protein